LDHHAAALNRILDWRCGRSAR